MSLQTEGDVEYDEGEFWRLMARGRRHQGRRRYRYVWVMLALAISITGWYVVGAALPPGESWRIVVASFVVAVGQVVAAWGWRR